MMKLKTMHDGMLLKHNSSLGVNIPYLLFSVYFVLYLALSLTILELQIYPLENRITYFDRVVSWSMTGFLQQDILIASAIFAIAILFTFRKHVSLPLSIVMIASPIMTLATTNYGPPYDSVIFMSSLPILIILLMISNLHYQKKRNNEKLQPDKSINRFSFQKFLTIFFLVFFAFQLLVFLNWIAYPVALEQLSESWMWKLNLLDNNLFYSFGLLSASLILLSILSFLIKPYIPKLASIFTKFFTSEESKHTKGSHDRFVASLQRNDLSEKPRPSLVVIQEKFDTIFQKETKTLLLISIIAFLTSILISFYSYSLVTDPNAILGTDIPVYSGWIGSLAEVSGDYSDFFYELFIGMANGDRPLSLLSLYLTSVISGQTLETLKNAPVILGPLLSFAIYFLTRVAYPENRKIAFLAALLTLFSHQVLIGFYAAFYANWMALTTLAVSSAFLIKSINEQNHIHRNLVLFFIFTTLTLFFHSYTWSYFIALVTLFLVWTAIQKKRSKQSVKIVIILGIITASIIGIDTIKSYYTGSTDSFQKDLNIAEFRVGYDEFTKRWENLSTTFTVHLGGFFTNSAILLLLFLWTLKANYNNNSDRFFLSMIFVALLPVLFGDFLVQSRIFYNIPIQIPASIMMYKIYKSSDVTFGKPLLFALIFMQFNYALRAMANMNFVPPS